MLNLINYIRHIYILIDNIKKRKKKRTRPFKFHPVPSRAGLHDPLTLPMCNWLAWDCLAGVGAIVQQHKL